MNLKKSNILALILFGVLLFVIVFFFPKERERHKNALIRIGAGDDISGLLMEESLSHMGERYQPSQMVEPMAFQDCCSNTAEWAMNAKEINIGFYCAHMARFMTEKNKDIMIYGAVIMNGEVIVHKKPWHEVKTLGIMPGRKDLKTLTERTYPQIKSFHEITEKGILYAMEDGQIDAAVLDITKAKKLGDYHRMPVSDEDYISYVLVVEKDFLETEAFEDFINAYNDAAERLNETESREKLFASGESFPEEKKLKFLELD